MTVSPQTPSHFFPRPDAPNHFPTIRIEPVVDHEMLLSRLVNSPANVKAYEERKRREEAQKHRH